MSVITNIEIMGLDSSIKASKYPVSVNIKALNSDIVARTKSLGASSGGHDQFLTGIRVNFDLTFSNKAWVEAERYRFLEFVSSQSTMHRITAMDIGEMCNEYVCTEVKDACEWLKQRYLDTNNNEYYLKLLYNLPSGFELTARMATNYRCLKNIYHQRKNHKLPEWRKFCEEILALPHFKELCLGKERED